MHSTQRHILSLWLHTIVVITLHPLHSWHNTPYIWHHTHGNTNVLSATWQTVYNTISNVSVSWNTGYQLYHTHSLYDITHTIRVTSYTVCMLSHQLFMTLYPSMYNITPSIFMTSYLICTLSPYCFHDNTMTIHDISPTIFDITATVSVALHRWRTHLYQWFTLSMASWQVCKSSHLAHVWHHTQTTSHHIHTLWHQWSFFLTSQTLNTWHQISSIWHHIDSLGHHTTLCMTSSPLYLTSHPLYLCHHTHPINDIIATICMVSHPVYLWHHIPSIYDLISIKYDITTLCVDYTSLSICVISFALQMTSHPLYQNKPQYLWCHIHFRHNITPPVSDIAPTVSLSSQPLHWYHTHFWMTSHPPSVWHHMYYI